LLSQLRVSQSIQGLLRCPICRAKITLSLQQCECRNSSCRARFPIIDGIPILINEKSSVFSIQDFTSGRATYFPISKKNWKSVVWRFVPKSGKNIKAKENYIKVANMLPQRPEPAKVLVIGGSILGEGMDSIVHNSFQLVETDVSMGSRTSIISDAHDIPFENESFDAVIVQAVLEHVVDPYRCVEETHRVLKEKGLVYAETPFMQQVHGGRYDFTRFTHLGHRRLFRHFEEIDSGAVCGPGMALAWSYEYFLTSFSTSRKLRRLLTIFARLTSFYFKYLDSYLINKPGTLNSASAYYFLGRKSNSILTDRELIGLFKGAD